MVIYTLSLVGSFTLSVLASIFANYIYENYIR